MNKPELGSCFFILLGWRACPVWGLKGPWDITLGACAQGLQRGWGVSVRRGQGCPRPGTAGSGRFHSLACWVPQPHERHFRGMYLTKGETLPGHEEPLLPLFLFPSSSTPLLCLTSRWHYPLCYILSSFSCQAGSACSHEGEDPFPLCNENGSPNWEHLDLPILHQEYLNSICISF